MEKRKKTLLILGLCIFTLALVGLSYAFWQITLQQTDENLVYTDCLKLDFKDENAISLQNAYPMTYEEQKSFFASETPYHFTITNECASKANLSINIETLPIKGKNKLDDEWVDVILYEGNENYNMYETPVLNNYEYYNEGNEHYKVTASPKNDNRLLNNSIDAYNLYNFTIEKNEEKDFSMYLFLDEDTPLETESGKKTTNAEWKGKVTINAAYRVPVKGMLKRIGSPEEDSEDTESMWQYSELISQIVFENKLQPHEETELFFDESDNGDGSVMSYLVPNDDQIEVWDYESSEFINKTAYTAYIQADGSIYGNYDSSFLFYGFRNVTEINGLEYFDTSKVTDMHVMFEYMISLKELDLPKSFDTSNVTDMMLMFDGMESLTKLNLSSAFNTSQVTNMYSIFSDMYALTDLDLSHSNFNTSNVTNMSFMFSSMSALTTLNLGENFDTSNVTSMRYMFSGNTELNQVDYGDYFVHKEGANTDLMFDGCPDTLNKPTDESWSGEEWYNPS